MENENEKENVERCSKCGKPLLPGTFQHRLVGTKNWYCDECFDEREQLKEKNRE